MVESLKANEIHFCRLKLGPVGKAFKGFHKNFYQLQLLKCF